MQTPIESPRAPNKKTVLQLPSNSPRTNVAHKSKPRQGNESPQQSGLPLIPNNSSGKVQLFRDLASPNHKQLEDKYSFRHLSSSLADIRASVETKDNTPSPMSPNKKGNSPKVNTKSVHEYYAKDEIKSPFENSPKRAGYEKPRVPGKNQKTVGPKARNNRLLAETRSLSPVASATILGLKDEVREEASPTMSNPFKVSYVEPKSATLRRDFTQYPIPEHGPIIKNNDFYTQIHSGYVVNMDSTMKNAYKSWMTPNFVRQEAPKDTLKPEQNTFFGRTNYNSEYLNFDSHKTIIEKTPRHLTTFADLAFAGKSSYRDTFASSPEPREFVSRWFNKKDHPPFPAVSVPSSTTYSTIYRPFKIGGGTGSDKPADYVSTQSFPNQYQSTYSREFDTKSELSRAFIEGSVPALSMRNIKA